MHGIIGEKFSIFLRELRCECLVVREHESRFIILRYDIRHGECLARSCHTEERLMTHAFFEPLLELFYRLWLVSRRRVWGV